MLKLFRIVGIVGAAAAVAVGVDRYVLPARPLTKAQIAQVVQACQDGPGRLPPLPPESVEPPPARVPCDAQADQPPAGGPFRPRPKPVPPLPPEPPAPAPDESSMDGRERRLFENIRKWVEAREARVEARVEARADARSEARINATLEELANNLDSVKVDDNGVVTVPIQGAFTSLLAGKLADLIKRVVSATLKILIRVVIGEIVMSHLGWLVGGLLALIGTVWGIAWAAGRAASWSTAKPAAGTDKKSE